jgi:hypothetical protein
MSMPTESGVLHGHPNQMNYPAEELRGIRCHAGLDKPAPAFSKPGASSLDFWIPTFILLWRISRDDDSPQADGVLKNKWREEYGNAQRFFSSRYTTRGCRELENVCEQFGKILRDAGKRH